MQSDAGSYTPQVSTVQAGQAAIAVKAIQGSGDRIMFALPGRGLCPTRSQSGRGQPEGPSVALSEIDLVSG